jgi:hypothetical protein
MNATLTPELLQQADSFLDTEQQHEEAVKLGQELFNVFGSDKEGRVSTQIRNLQQIVISAIRFADIEDFVKNQMGKEKSNSDKGSLGPWRKVGDRILKQLAQLRQKAKELATDEGQRLLLRLYLARGWVRAVIGAYLYAKAHREMEESHA